MPSAAGGVSRLGRLLAQVLAPNRCAAAQEEEWSPEWRAYREERLQRAMALGNRGPMRFGPDGLLTRDILEKYWECGFYVFENVIAKDEVAEITREFDEVLENAPAEKGVSVDRHGRPVKFPGYYAQNKSGVISNLTHPLTIMDSALRVYAHPQILKMVESVHGPDFVPFTETIFHKAAGNGVPTDWHQDGRTHWDLANGGEALEQLDGTGKRHGFNLTVSFSNCTPENCLWVIPGSQRRWCLADGGHFPKITDLVPGAVPAVLNPGDLCLTNRSSLHGSFPNKSSERRVTLVIGYHNRASAVGTETTNVHAFKLPGKEKRVKYSLEHVMERARMIPLAIDARRQYYPEETPYAYNGSVIGSTVWSEEVRNEILEEGHEYWQRDMTL